MIQFEGKSAHAGNNPQDGICTVTEMAHWILFFKTLENSSAGISVNPGIAKGGTSANTIPEHAELHVDIRTRTQEDSLKIDQAVRAHTPHNPKVKITITGGISRPPMVPNPQSEELAKVLEDINKEVGLETKWVYAGGCSDASFGSTLNRATLCALGPRCGKAHSPEEYVEIEDLDKRFTQFKEVIRRFSTYQYKTQF